MTQRIFDVESEKDMADLWDTLREDINKVEPFGPYSRFYSSYHHETETHDLIKINWHDKTEITRPIKEATEADIGKLCYFWGNDENDYAYGILGYIGTENEEKYYNIDNIDEGLYFEHCRRLTKQEIEELC